MTDLLRGRYEALGVLGQGGEAQVLRALDHQHDRRVVLKIRPAPASVEREVLLSEARVLLALEPHPGLPLVREDFFLDDRYVIAMDWVDGIDLARTLMRDGEPGLPPAMVIDHLVQAAAALDHLHVHDPPVVHGDVKPANVIVTATGRVVVVDFGLSSVSTGASRRAGTAGFVAPEVAAGLRPTPAADVYALAATAFALLTGSSPAGGPLVWRGIDPQRVAGLERALRPGLATDPARRPASAGALVERLRQWWGADLPAGDLTFLAVEGPIDGTDVSPSAGRLLVQGDPASPAIAVFTDPGAALGAALALAGGKPELRMALHCARAEPDAGAYPEEVVAPAVGLLGRGEATVAVSAPAFTVLASRLDDDLGLADLGDDTYALVGRGLGGPAIAAGSPYRGLMSFAPEHRRLFFGRERTVADLVGRLSAARFLAVVGASGSGKSSLVKGGLVPALSRVTVVITPGANPLAALATASPEPDGLLVVDQLEEVFTLCRSDNERRRFLDAVVEASPVAQTIVVVLRADFYGHCATHRGLAEALQAHQFLLTPMDHDQLRAAIEGPARVAGLRLDPGLADLVAGEVSGEPGGLPLLSHALMETWKNRRGRVLTVAGYRETGGVRGAIARTADSVVEGLDADSQKVARGIFVRLTELGEGTADTRRPVARSELVPEPSAQAAVAKLLATLVEARLVTAAEGKVEVAHEALIGEWPRLRAWLAEDREGLRLHRHLSTAARDWERRGRDRDDLYRGARLVAAGDWAGAHGEDLNSGERAFLDASGLEAEHEREAIEERSRRQARDNRRLRRLLVGTATALVLAILAASVALVQRYHAGLHRRLADVGRLVAQSRAVREHQPDLGLLLAAEANRLHGSPETLGALLGALQQNPRMVGQLHGVTSGLEAAVFSPDGALLATPTFDGTILWDVATRRPRGQPLKGPAKSISAAFSPDGATLYLPDEDGKVELWDVASLRQRGELTSSQGEPLNPVDISPDGRWLATSVGDGYRAMIWDLGAGVPLGEPFETAPADEGTSGALSFSSDSTRLAVPGSGGTVGVLRRRHPAAGWSPARRGRSRGHHLRRRLRPVGATFGGGIPGRIRFGLERRHPPTSRRAALGR